MREFFRGWKRKVGCVTLVMALAFMGGWVRSFYFTDMIMFPTTNGLNRLISDRHGGLLWTIHGQTNEENDKYLKACEGTFGITIPFVLFAFPKTFGDLRAETSQGVKEWKRNCAFSGFGFLEGQDVFGQTVTVWFIPYWSIVIPLTLISFWLFLSKPDKSHPMKITDPTANEGA